MQTNRLRFVNVDESASLPQASAITGFTVVKSPRGTTLPQFFAKGNTNGILQLLGSPSSTYPAIQEVIDFNQTYGIWVSAPAGNVTGSVPNGLGVGNNLYSYFGGVYATTLASLEPFYHVAEDTAGTPVLNYYTLVTPQNYSSPLSNTTMGESYASNTITVDKINPNVFTYSKVVNVILTYPRPTGGTTATVTMTLNSGTGILHVANPTGGADLEVGEVVTSSFPGYLKMTIGGTGNQTDCQAYQNGTNFDLDFWNITLNPWLTAQVANIVVNWVYNIQSLTCGAIYQTSPRQYSGTFNLTSVDLRQYLYTTVQTDFTFTITSPPATAGNVILCGQTIPVSGAGNLDTAAHLATFLAGQTISGYTLTSPSSGVLRAVTTASKTLNPSLVIPPVEAGGLGGATYTTVVTNNGSAIANPNYNTMSFTYSETYNGSSTYSKSYQISTDTLNVDGYGQSRYMEDVLSGDSFIGTQAPLQQFTATQTSLGIPPTGTMTIVWNPQTATFLGIRAVVSSLFVDSTMLVGVLTEGWNLATSNEYQNTHIFFDAQWFTDSTIATIFSNLRASTYMFSTFVCGVKVSNPSPTTSAELVAAVEAIVTKRATYPNVTGLTYYCNEFLQKEIYTGTSFWGIPIGSVCAMLGQIMELRLGGVAPMFVNENSLGGQINKSVKRQKYNFDATSLDTLDAAAINPIILDPFYGIMMTSHRTAQSPINLTDWSYLGHQMSFDLFRKEVKDGVMLPQIGKLIDNFHLNLRHQQTQTILNKRLSGPTAIWAEGKVFVEDVNTAETRAENTFVIKVRVKVNPFSEYVELVFTNVAQTSSVG